MIESGRIAKQPTHMPFSHLVIFRRGFVMSVPSSPIFDKARASCKVSTDFGPARFRNTDLTRAVLLKFAAFGRRPRQPRHPRHPASPSDSLQFDIRGAFQTIYQPRLSGRHIRFWILTHDEAEWGQVCSDTRPLSHLGARGMMPKGGTLTRQSAARPLIGPQHVT